MKTFFALATLATLMQATATTAVATAADIDIKSEFLRWKASDAGQLAYKNGFVPSRSTGSATSKVSILSADDEPTQDELTRFQNSLDAVARIQEQQPHATFSIDTPFALMTSAEYAAYVEMGGAQRHFDAVREQIRPVNTSVSTTTVNASTTTFTTTNSATRKLDTWVVNVDWQTKGCVTKIKNQGYCGVCWAFSATAALESGYCAHTGTLHELSAQEVASCSRNNAACIGSNSNFAYDWLTRLNGGSLCTDASYPYVSGGGSVPGCRVTEDPSFWCEKPNLGAYYYTGGYFADHTQLEAAVLQQPVAVSFNIRWDAFQYYKGGVFMGNEQYCPADKYNHEVTIVGFGTLNGIPYWKIKNQYSESWGDHGYMYIERGYQGHTYGACGVEGYGFYPVFTSASDSRRNRRATTPHLGFAQLGNTLKEVSGTFNADQCASRCLQEPTCVGFTFRNAQQCVLMSKVTGFTEDSTWYGAVITKAQSLQNCAPIADNVDFPGHDLRVTVAATAEECCDHCSMVEQCNAFTWSKFKGGMCYLKKQVSATPATWAPDADGTPYVRSGSIYKCQPLQQNKDFTGSDLSSAPSSSAANCCGICRSTDYCFQFTWTNYNGGTCWLKQWSLPFTTVAGSVSAYIH